MTALAFVPFGIVSGGGLWSIAVTLAVMVLLAHLCAPQVKKMARAVAVASALAVGAYAILPFTCGRMWWLVIECWF